jgi:hypothetical protein
MAGMVVCARSSDLDPEHAHILPNPIRMPPSPWYIRLFAQFRVDMRAAVFPAWTVVHPHRDRSLPAGP